MTVIPTYFPIDKNVLLQAASTESAQFSQSDNAVVVADAQVHCA
jgi:hypothetical protein